jgi:hypothetical protein
MALNIDSTIIALMSNTATAMAMPVGMPSIAIGIAIRLRIAENAVGIAVPKAIAKPTPLKMPLTIFCDCKLFCPFEELALKILIALVALL